MGEGSWPGEKQLALLGLIRQHEEEVEADLQRYYQTDYRDFYRGGGASGLTARRLTVLVDNLPSESAFMSAVADRDPISETSYAVMDIYFSLTGKENPRIGARKRRREQAEREKLMEIKRAEARKFNAPRLAKMSAL